MRLVRAIIVLALLAVLPASASASPSDVLKDCARNGKLTRKYSRADLQGSLKNFPGDLAEYSNCRDVVAEALAVASARKSGGRDSAGGGGNGRDGGARGGSAGPSSSGRGDRRKTGRGRKAAGGSDRGRDAVGGGSAGGASGGGDGSRGAGGPGVAPGRQENGADGVPAPLIVALVLLAALILAGVAFAVRRRLPPGARNGLARRGRT